MLNLCKHCLRVNANLVGHVVRVPKQSHLDPLKIRELRQKGYSIDEIGKISNYTRRSVFRLLEKTADDIFDEQ